MPDFKAYVRENLPALGVAGTREVEIVEELALEFEQKYERAINGGLTPEQAWESITNRAGLWSDLSNELRSALNERQAKSLERQGGSHFSRFTDNLFKDLNHSARIFLKTPGFTFAAIAALALGIGTSTAIFSVINTVLLKPFAYPDADRIVMFQNTFQQNEPTGSASPTEFNWWRQQTESFEYISAYDFDVVNSTGESFPEQIPAMRVSADFLRLCGAAVLHGRAFAAADDLPNAPKTVVLDFAFWQRHFGGDPRVIGRTMTLSADSYEIIGVIGPHLQNGQIAEQSLGSGDIAIEEPPDVYIPFQLDPNSSERGHFFNVAGRLKPRVTLPTANAQLQASFREYTRKWPDVDPGAGFRVQSLLDAVVGGVRKSLLILVGAVGFVLLIACANVANLLLARATGRKREFAIRAALGAGRGRIVRQLLTESVMLSLAGGVSGLAVGYAGVRAILHLSPGNIPRIGIGGSNVDLDWRVLSFALGLSILTGIVFGLLPTLQSSRADLSGTLKESGDRGGTGLRQNNTRALLVTTEIALALVLLIGAALLIRTFIAIRQVNPGFDAHNVLTMRMSLTGPQFEKPAGVTQVVHEGIRRINALPGVEVAGTTCCVPLEDRLRQPFQIVGRPEGPSSRVGAGWTLVSPAYFETFKIPVLRGRVFTERDETGPPVVIINQALAKRFWPDRNPLDDRIVMGAGLASKDEPARQIIGVVGDVHDGGLNRDARPNMYVLAAQLTTGQNLKVLRDTPWAWVIRTRVAPLSLSSTIQNELREASGGLPVARVRSMEEVLARSTDRESFNMLVLTVFGCSALLLAAIGIYGLMAYSVAQRGREIGIRMALGATSSYIRNMVVFQGLKLALAGVVVGLLAAFGLTHLIASFLFGVRAWDPLVFILVPMILIGIALLAVLLPAMRACRVDPIRALRFE